MTLKSWPLLERKSPSNKRAPFLLAHSYKPFAIYRYFAGSAVLLLIATGVRSATF